MLDWFTTIPGILIICGVILLVIAIILLIVGTKKSKKESASTTDNTVNNTSSVVNVESPVETVPVSEEITTPSVDTTVNVEEVKTEVPVSEPIHIEEPEVTDMSNVGFVPYTEPIENTTPVINIPDMDSRVEDTASEVVEHPSTIYGGEMPTIDFTPQEEKPVTIYGGNDPLDATQTLPKMEEHHVPYGGSYPEVRIVEPTAEEVAPTPVEETVTEMPTVEPEVINIPVEEPTVVETEVTTEEVNTEKEEPAVEEL